MDFFKKAIFVFLLIVFGIIITVKSIEPVIEKQKLSSDIFFEKNNKFFDLIYIDGDHQTDQVNKDINNAWKILNDGGYLILDDYTWWWYNDLNKNPASAINNFIYNNISSIDVENLIIWKQVLIKKKSL